MAISPYFDNELNKECYRVQVVRKSAENPSIVVRKRADKLITEAEALKVEKKLIGEAHRELVDKEAHGMSWLILIDQYELAMRNDDVFVRKLAKGSQQNYISALRGHTKEWFKHRVEQIDKAKAWLLLDRIERDYSIAKRKSLRTAIDGLYSWAILSGRIKSSTSLPTEGFKSVSREDEPLPEILNLEEIRILLREAYTQNNLWYPIWAMALYTGMRSGELYALEWTSVDFENRMIYVHRNWTNKAGFHSTKGGYWRAVPISDELLPFLRELKLKSREKQFVLPRFHSWEDGRQAEILRVFCVGIGVPSIKFHTLRACFATQLIKNGVAPGKVMKMCGWKDLKTMQRYIRLAGIEVKGATDGLKLLPEEKMMGEVVNLFNG